MSRRAGRLARLLGVRARERPPGARERFRHFSRACAENDAFLGVLAELMDAAEAPARVDLRAVAHAYETLSESAAKLVASLQAISGGAYPDLGARYEAIDREITSQVLRERPLEVAALVVWPNDPDAERPEIVGGKAANLSIAGRRAGIVMPAYFAVTAHAYRLFLEANGVGERIRERLWPLDANDAAALREASETIRRDVLEAPVPADLARALLAGYRRLVPPGEGHGVAVRSSGVFEDSDRSFAGQFESVLGVREKDLVQAYKQVLASAFRAETLRYARLSGFLDTDVEMPVLVMAMVQPAASGVAYSIDPDRADAVLITAVRGLASEAVHDRVTPDRYVVERDPPHGLLSADEVIRPTVMRVGPEGGVVEAPDDALARGAGALDAAGASQIGSVAMRLESAFGRPVDLEWVEDDDGAVLVVQSRPLLGVGEDRAAASLPAVPAGYRVLVSGGIRIFGGIECGPVVRVFDLENLDAATPGSVLVVPTTSPKLAAIAGQVVAIVADAGSPTGHMATVAREFGIPSIVGAGGAMRLLRDGEIVTVDAWAGRIYEGEVVELLAERRARAASPPNDPARACLKELLARVSPLHLSDPDAPEFSAAACRSLHDVARFVHQKVIAEMFEAGRLGLPERREVKRLQWKKPMEMMILDLGEALAPGARGPVALDQIVSTPMKALLEGMTDPRLRWTGPVGFDLKGFMSVVVRSAADDRRYGEPSYMIGARDYVLFSSRLAYHFASVDAMCGASANQNYVRFAFHGGAAVAQRREWRAQFLADVLRYNGFQVKLVGDRVTAALFKRGADVIEECLVMLGRLMVCSRQLDMVMDSRAAAAAFAAAFLAGDYGFDSIRKD